MKIRAGVIGSGYLGRFHAQKYQQLGHLVGVYDTNPKKSLALATELGCPSFRELQPLLEQVNVASITASTEAHFELVQQCLNYNIALLLEKPATDNLKQAQQLLSLVKTAQAMVQIGHLERFNPAFKAAQAQVEQPQFIEAWRLATFSGRSANTSILFDLMIHDLDLVLQFVRQPVHSIRAVGAAVFNEQLDTASVHIQFKGGCIANLNASRAAAATIRQMNIVDLTSVNCLDFQTQSFTRTLKSKPGATVPTATVPLQDNLMVEIQSFLNAVKQNFEPVVSLDEAVETIKLATQIEQKISEQKTAMPNPEMPNPEMPDPAMPNPAMPNPEMPGPAMPNPAMPGPKVQNP